MNIVEAYQKKLSISEKVYAKEHGGRALSENKKIAIARVLANTSEYITEAFSDMSATQLSNMKTFKKFCLDLTTVALPSLIANDLVIVFPLKSRTGYIQYLQFTAGTTKGGVTADETVFNDPFKLGVMDDHRVEYTSAVIVDPTTTTGEGEAKKTSFTASWNFNVVDDGFYVKDNEEVSKYTEGATAYKYKIVHLDGTVTYAADTDTLAEGDKVVYKYNNFDIPQDKMPTLTARMNGIDLSAKARRIAVYYSQMAAFQAKTEMGIDLGEILATQACAELSYEIDTEVVKMLVDNARLPENNSTATTWNKRCPLGVSKRDHYAGFAEVIEIGSQVIYDRTQKHAANYMLIASNIKPVLSMMEGWKAANTAKMNGPYYAGELNGIKVYVSPAIKAGKFVLGYNGGDMITSAAVYAPYMAIVPTQLLGFADGAMSQGFSTLYDLKLLNPALLVAGEVVDVQEEYRT